MTLGEKVKAVRIQKRMTQSELGGDVITRNMLSAIENDKALPSLETLRHISIALDTPISYFLSDGDDLFLFTKAARMPSIVSSLRSGCYNACVNQILKLEKQDDELTFILSKCYFEMGIVSVKNGALLTAKEQLLLSLEYAKKTVYDTARFEAVIPLYLAICHNISSPLLEFDEPSFLGGIDSATDYEFYKYVIQDSAYHFKNEIYSRHLTAKQLIKERRYNEAVGVLTELEKERKQRGSNAYINFCLYGDIEICYRQLLDFENAYKYATKRMSMLEGFKQ